MPIASNTSSEPGWIDGRAIPGLGPDRSSISSHATPRRTSSDASTNPVGPAPTTSTVVASVVTSPAM